ncbi:RNA-binding protein [Oceanomicrobium pacificus]|uniref:RNA-binding protein n=1 Tax=Oceanomicrobium pacificus TaxID=2692916 RepID=A0A6B0TUW0_9RHOB|nr:RNA-binding protein [Oceanomicrobium pacificus]MXU64733.1 RNA-binding protein [Oceanomicrobium pacificus]
MSRGGRTKDRSTPERRCIATGDTAPKAGLIRFVAAPDGQVVPDLSGKLPGRGLWVSADRAAIDLAVRKGLFSRAARQKLDADPDLADRVESLLARRVIDLLSLGRKAGLAVAGREKTRDALVSGDAALLVQAHDGSAREKSAFRPPNGPESHVTCLSAKELGLAFGRETVIHAALKAGGITKTLRAEAMRLAGLRQGQGQGAPAGRTDRTGSGDEG